MMVWEWES